MHSLHRENLCKKLGEGLVFGFGNKSLMRNGYDNYYSFRQNSNFLYLTGIQEEDHAFILDLKSHEFTLFIPKIDALHIVWLGDVPGLADSKQKHGADKVYYITEFLEHFKKHVRNHKKVYFLQTNNKDAEKIYKSILKVKPLEKELIVALAQLRFQKTPFEIELMKKAAGIAAEGHIEAMKRCKAGLFEYEIQSFVEQKFRAHGARFNAYDSIVGSGKNSAILHYFKNQDQLREGDLLLIDAGAEYQGYASDVTRTFPISGKFSSKQKDIYEIVLNAQREAIKILKPGTLYRDFHMKAAHVIIHGLKEIGILKGSLEALKEKRLDRLFFPHGIGHPLGLDTHDVDPHIGMKKKLSMARLKQEQRFEENTVVTAEPGIYFIPALLNDPKNRKEYSDFVNWKKVESFLDFGGVRIEDDILVTSKGPLNLTQKTPKKVSELEKIIGSKK